MSRASDPRGLGTANFDDMSPPTPVIEDAHFIRFAIEQLTRDEDVLGRGRDSSITYGAPDINLTRPQPPSQIPKSASSRPLSHQTLNTNISRHSRQNAALEETMVAVSPPQGQTWPEMGYKPQSLRPWALGVLLLVTLLFLAGALFSNVYASRNNGLYDYDGFTTATYFVFQYLPQLLGIVLIIFLNFVQAAIYRSAPFFSMSGPRSQYKVLQNFRITPSNFLLPDLNWFRVREPLLGISFMVFWLINLTVPLLSCLYQTQWVTSSGDARWMWTTSQDVGWTLVGMYATLNLAVACILVRFWRTPSALTWDPVCLADYIVLFSRSNVSHHFERTEILPDVNQHIPPMSLMLGYWTTSRFPGTFYTIGGENALIKSISVEGALAREKEPASQDSSFDVERHRYSYDSAFTRDIHSPLVRNRSVPWFLRRVALVVWTALGFGLLIAFLVISFVNDAVENGFEPLLPSITSMGGFSSSNFLYSFLPSLLGMIVFLVWQPIDVYFRSVQPYANLSSPKGASAERSLLLSYNAGAPLWASIEALINRDYRVALISLNGLLSGVIPVLAGGVFTAQQRGDGRVLMLASLPGYIALCVFVSIYVLSILLIWPGSRRHLPHPINTLADQLSFLYASPLMTEFWNIRTKADLVRRLVGTPAGLTGDWREKRTRARYAFGIFTGRDGKEHLGIDRLARPGSGEMLVVTGAQR
jgi:hypothetical protein